MALAKKAEAVEINIPALDEQVITLTLVGKSNLVMHRFSEKAKKEMLDKMQKKVNQ